MKKSTVKKLLKYINKYNFFMAISIIMAVIRVSTALYLPLQVSKVIDYMVGVGKVDFVSIKKMLMQVIIFICITVVSQWIMGVCNNHVTFHVTKNLRNDLIKKIQALPLRIVDSKNSGDLVSRIIADVDQVGDGLLLGFSQAFVSFFTIILTLIFMLRQNGIITLVVVVLTPISFFVASFIAKRSYNMFTKQSVTRGEQTALINEIIPNEAMVKAYSYEDKAIERFNEVNNRLSGYSLKATFYSSITNPATRFVNNLVYASVGIIGVIFVIRGHITVGILSAFLSYANQYTKPFNDISSVITEFQNALACASRVFEFMEFEEEEEFAKGVDSTEAMEDIPIDVDIQGTLKGEKVYFKYNDSAQILKGADFSVKKGHKCAIVGPTGCGKTTIINLIMRFYDIDSGSLYLDDYDIGKVQREFIRNNIGMVLQETWLQTGTVAENISFGKPDATMDEIKEAAKSCFADSFIRKLPNGYDTVISEGGGNLSQGQKQLLCIARVMLMKPKVLILDEATSNIDTLTEIKIVKAFDKLMEGRTSLIVAHRLSTIKNADCIFVLNQGVIQEEGNHDELLKKNGLYAELYNSQFA